MNLEQKFTFIGPEAYRLCNFLKFSLTMLGAGPTETEQDSVGLLGTETFQPVANQGREGCRDLGEAAKRQQCRLGAVFWFHLKGYT